MMSDRATQSSHTRACHQARFTVMKQDKNISTRPKTTFGAAHTPEVQSWTRLGAGRHPNELQALRSPWGAG